MSRFKCGFLALLALAAVPLTAARAAEASSTTQRTSESSAYHEKTATNMGAAPIAGDFTLRRFSEINGIEVQGTNGEKIGTVEDVVLNPRHTRIDYVAVKHGDTAGMGGSTVAVPWSDFKQTASNMASGSEPNAMTAGSEPDAKLDHLTLNQSKESLAQLPAMMEGQWPAHAGMKGETKSMSSKDSSSYSKSESGMTGKSETSSEYSSESSKTEKRDMKAASNPMENRRLSKLIGSNVVLTTGMSMSSNKEESSKSSSDMSSGMSQSSSKSSTESSSYASKSGAKDFGTLTDAVINTNNGAVAYAFVKLSDASNQSGDSSVIPWSALRFRNQTAGTVALNANSSTISSYAYQSGSEQDQLKRLSQSSYSHQVYDAYEQGDRWDALGYVNPDASASSGNTSNSESKSESYSSDTKIESNSSGMKSNATNSEHSSEISIQGERNGMTRGDAQTQDPSHSMPTDSTGTHSEPDTNPPSTSTNPPESQPQTRVD